MQGTSLIHLSHHSISLIQNNPQKYLQIYLEHKKVLPSPQVSHHFEIGSAFHLVMKQIHMGLPVKQLLDAYPKIKQWIKNLELVAPHIFSATPENSFKECEYPRNLILKGCLLCCIYDMIITSDNEASIIEWTTAKIPFNAQILNWHWQTRFYLYVFVESMNYQPEEVSLTYYFVNTDSIAQQFTVYYTATQHCKTQLDLLELIDRRNQLLKNYNKDKLPSKNKLINPLLDIENIPEVPI
ncbi:MAG: PD-(D/E)XK nuclease family protein [Richelia sp. SL_2_1]|nr:PD-(D/E)XK nuclease family protein [Richelia sp. SM1_7_0]NJN14043.1 PD-(D/E)XK nuclease family protein [Richelia sp. RM1_1_1]NJO29004.1 PD-(D/E)XK nuclease family protein [Richelia sp. SL_2_1]